MADRRKKDTKREILEIRSKIARKLLSEARKGNMSFCEPNRTEEERNKYCSGIKKYLKKKIILNYRSLY